MKEKFTLENSIMEILEQSDPEMELYLLPSIIELIPEEYRSKPMKDWIDTYLMPWGFPLNGEAIVGDANMLIDADRNRELIPLWVTDDFSITSNSRQSVCLIVLKDTVPETDDIRPCVIVVPGGGYENIAFHDEGFATARRLAVAGYRPFILNYRFAPNHYPNPQLDLAMAIRHLRANADKYRINPDNLMILGYSAGGHLCASTAAFSAGLEESLDLDLSLNRPDLYEATRGISIRPDKVCLCYPVISFLEEDHEPSFQALTGGNEDLREHLSIEKQVKPDYPKTFIWTCADDSLVPPSNATRMAEALKEKGVPCMLKVYPTGEHGCNVGDGTSAEGWMNEMLAFMKE